MMDPSPNQFDEIIAMSGTMITRDQQSAVIASRANGMIQQIRDGFVKTQALSSTFITLTRMCYTQQQSCRAPSLCIELSSGHGC